MKKIVTFIVIGAAILGRAFATEEFNMVDETTGESYGQCYITPENQSEWDEENAKIEAMLEHPELQAIFELMDEAASESEIAMN